MAETRFVAEDLPLRLRKLPLDPRGYPVPWFVAWVNGEPEFRAADGRKFAQAVQHKLCWVCGEPLGKWLAFPIGPMCAITRTTAEPPTNVGSMLYTVIDRSSAVPAFPSGPGSRYGTGLYAEAGIAVFVSTFPSTYQL